MAVDDPRRAVRHDLVEAGLSMESASYLVDDRPPGGWDSLVTKHELRAELAEIRTEMAGLRTEMATMASELRKEMRDQSWRLTTALLASVTLMAAILRLG